MEYPKNTHNLQEPLHGLITFSVDTSIIILIYNTESIRKTVT